MRRRYGWALSRREKLFVASYVLLLVVGLILELTVKPRLIGSITAFVAVIVNVVFLIRIGVKSMKG